MSRAKLDDNSTAVSLFPFLAVLLCTMGALLVVLVAVSRSAREAAFRRAEATAAAKPAPVVEPANDDIATKAEIGQANAYKAKLDETRRQALRKLREDQQRLSHLEDHMRRLQNELGKLRLVAAELEALEGEHYDDQTQAEREVERLQQLIAETRDAIESIQQEQKGTARSYALVPYEGANGTVRRPIYVECRKGELILQPEGVRVTRDDLRPPLGAGNPLAAALRAARSYAVQMHPEEGRNRDSEPYPLIIVRPSGAAMYGLAQRAIQSSDFDFGYELVEEEWDLKYPAADPQLAMVEQQAIEHARARQDALAAAAPRAFRHPGLAAAGRFEFDHGGSEFGLWGADGSADGGEDVPGLESRGLGAGELSGSGPAGEAGAIDGNGADPSQSTAVQNQASSNGAAESRQQQSSSAGASAEGNPSLGSPDRAMPGGMTGGSPTPGAAAVGNSSSPTNSAEQDQAARSIGMQTGGPGQTGADLAATRGNDWALKGKQPRAVPVRRSIPVVVSGDQLLILRGPVRSNSRLDVGKTVPLPRDTVASIDEFVDAVQNEIDAWGIAGHGLYWRPVLTLHIRPDGTSRAQDLARLLKDSGLELQPATATHLNLGGRPSATR